MFRCLSIATLFALAALAWSQTPAPNRDSRQPSVQDQRGTEQSPLFIKEVPATAAHEKHAPWWVDEIAAFSTLAIAFFTVVTVFVFLYQVGVTHDVERCWVTVSLDSPPNDILQYVVMPTSGMKLNRELFFTNRGRTPGKVTGIRARFCYVQSLASLPREPDYGTCSSFTQMPSDGRTLVPTEDFRLTVFFEGPNKSNIPTDEEMRNVRAGSAHLVVFGIADYRDAFSRSHYTSFCFVYQITHNEIPYAGWFLVDGPSEYNKTT
jgi:hypothetical protein